MIYPPSVISGIANTGNYLLNLGVNSKNENFFLCIKEAVNEAGKDFKLIKLLKKQIDFVGNHYYEYIPTSIEKKIVKELLYELAYSFKKQRYETPAGKEIKVLEEKLFIAEFQRIYYVFRLDKDCNVIYVEDDLPDQYLHELLFKLSINKKEVLNVKS